MIEHNLLPPPVSVTISPLTIDPLDPTGLERVCWIVAIYPDQSVRSWRVRVTAPRASAPTESSEPVEPPIQIGPIVNAPRDRKEATTYAEQVTLAAVEAATAPRINALIPFQRRDGSPSVACLVYDSARRAVLAWDLRRSHRQHITIASDATTGCCALEYHSPFVVTWSGHNVHLWHESEIVEELERAAHSSDARPEGLVDLMIPSLELRAASPVSTVACNQHVLLIGHRSGLITAWSVPSSHTSAADISSTSSSGAKELCQLGQVHRKPIIELRLLEDCKFACSIAEDCELRLWSLSSGKCVCSFKELSGLSAQLAPFSLVVCQGQDVVLHDFLNVLPISRLMPSQALQPSAATTTYQHQQQQTSTAMLPESSIVLQQPPLPTTATVINNDPNHESNDNNNDDDDDFSLSMLTDCTKELEHEGEHDRYNHDQSHKYLVSGDYRDVIESEEEAARLFERQEGRGPSCTMTRGVIWGIVGVSVVNLVIFITAVVAITFLYGQTTIVVFIIVFMMASVIGVTSMFFCGVVRALSYSQQHRTSAREQLREEAGVVVATW